VEEVAACEKELFSCAMLAGGCVRLCVHIVVGHTKGAWSGIEGDLHR
jgi:hypothetical protein